MAHEAQVSRRPSAKVAACTHTHGFGFPRSDSRSSSFFSWHRPIVQVGRGSALAHDPWALSNHPATLRYILPMKSSEGLRLDAHRAAEEDIIV